MSSLKKWTPTRKTSIRALKDMMNFTHGYRLAIQDSLKDIQEMPGKGHGYGYIDGLQDVQAKLLDTLEQADRTLGQLDEQLANRRTP